MTIHIDNRDRILQSLKEEIVGPSPRGKTIDCTVPIVFQNREDSYGPWRQEGSGEEILQRDPPYQRYGAGVLSPIPSSRQLTLDMEADTDAAPELRDLDVIPGAISDDESPGSSADIVSEDTVQRLNRVVNRVHGMGAEDDSDDLVLASANAHKPSSMGISFFADLQDGAILTVDASGGRYRKIEVAVGNYGRTWWLRIPVTLSYTFKGEDVRDVERNLLRPLETSEKNTDGLNLKIEVFARSLDAHPTYRLITVCLVNRTPDSGSQQAHLTSDEIMLFQSQFTIRVTSPSGETLILPYPEAPIEQLDEEEQSLALLYRQKQTFAAGHGCSADWTINNDDGRVTSVRAECFPVVEIESTSPEIRREDDSILAVPMRALAGLDAGDDGLAAVEEVIDRYEAWVALQRGEASELLNRHYVAAERHLDECSRSVERMRSGLRYLRSDPVAAQAFQLANHAMLLQQTRSRRSSRDVAFDARSERLLFSEEYPALYPEADRGEWRPFQIAFLLASVESTGCGDVPDRRTVELIWFPTGGGKTEAYLGLSAFAIYLRRLRDPSDSGTHVLMRYTLRLLTAQQFQRAAGLICAMEYLRRTHNRDLGEDPITIGIWLGGDTTPNRRSHAVKALKELKKGDKWARNYFILTRCPWCGAQMGPVDLEGQGSPKVVGYVQRGDTVALSCPDRQCSFNQGLPVLVVDDDIYEERPALIIGTVDKFAMLAWRSEARAIFGIAPNGDRDSSPPGLIIQDELHLISGPLGSMVGLYETVIEELCTDHRGDRVVSPKIVSSTATIRRYREQIKALYGRDRVNLFPPPGLDAGNSFFSSYARRADGSFLPGRKYVGVHAPGLGSMQTTETRVFASLLQAPMPLTDEERDPWWTMMIFFNSLRDLGTALSLFQSRVPDYLFAIRSRTGIDDLKNLRSPNRIKELTSRLRSDEVPAAIVDLETACGSGAMPIDACLASNIIEVGIDIDRLSLMTVVGQPKTTSQYIQVTGRVGRRWWERPGLVVTLLNPSRPRDRSHFEHFRSYHERLYAQVEPTSVTPFSPPALERALHAVLVCYARQKGDERLSANPNPFPEELIDRAERLLLDRVTVVDPIERDNLKSVLRRRVNEWKRWEHRHWSRDSDDIDLAQMYVAGEYIDAGDAHRSWATPMSMRSIDAECQAEITRLYLDEPESELEDVAL